MRYPKVAQDAISAKDMEKLELAFRLEQEALAQVG
jgi:hypothetical protein